MQFAISESPLIAMSAINLRQLCALFLLLLLVCCVLHLGSAQVTFSKGWGPGKRAVLGDPDCRVNAKSLGLLFNSLMAELKRSMACDHRAAVNYLQAAIGEH